MTAKRKRGGHKPRQPNDLHTIESFCQANKISVSTYYALKRDGRGPKEMVVNKRRLITPEAEAAWRRAREAEAHE